jgi:hypothetical protein
MTAKTAETAGPDCCEGQGHNRTLTLPFPVVNTIFLLRLIFGRLSGCLIKDLYNEFSSDWRRANCTIADCGFENGA